MKERPILFSAPMVKALLEGRKTQTRRIVKPQPPAFVVAASLAHDNVWNLTNSKTVGLLNAPTKCPYGKPGDRLWVKERHRFVGWDADGEYYTVEYSDGVRAVCEFGGEDGEEFLERMDRVGRKYGTTEEGQHILDLGRLPQRPSIFMPRWASRITLEITDVRVQRVEEISGEDARAEGCGPDFVATAEWARRHGRGDAPIAEGHRARFLQLFYDINKRAKRGENPWVWALTFKVVKS